MTNETRSVALITGGARRIGAEIARTLHASGMDIALHYHRSENEAQALAHELQAVRADSVCPIQADLNQVDPQQLIQRVSDWRGRLDLLVNNASNFFPTPVDHINDAQWDALMGTNLRAPLFLSLAAAPLLRSNQGSIVNLVDIHAERPLAGHTLYCMAKAGNAMMVKSLARELGPDIRVNGVAPGAILWPDQTLTNEERQAILSRTQLGRLGTPADIAQTVRFLALEASYMTGEIIRVDGGRSVQQ